VDCTADLHVVYPMAYLFLALSAPQILSGIIGSAQPIEDGASLY